MSLDSRREVFQCVCAYDSSDGAIGAKGKSGAVVPYPSGSSSSRRPRTCIMSLSMKGVAALSSC